jgi:phage shock protein PspC (stress-responsive transcriptional regulator)
MNEITRIHIAKVAYDIEVSAKKQLEKYIKSLESYTQDSEVLADIEIRMTELLAERNVAANGVIGTEDVAAIRKQLGEPYEFADGDGDIAVGAVRESDESHRLYRSMDDAVLGGVLSGIAAYFKVNPLWTRLIFILIAFISFGLALPVYIVLWIILPQARTAAQKLQLAGKPVTLASIRELNVLAETNPSRSVAPALRRVLEVSLGILNILAAITVLAVTIWAAVLVLAHGGMRMVSENVFGTGNQDFLGWLVFWLVITGALLLTALLSIMAYAFLAQKLTKRMIISGIIIVALGLTAAAASVSIVATQSWRVFSEAQASVQTTKLNLPDEFSSVKSIVFDKPTKLSDANYYTALSSIQYIVDEGTPRYELSALPKAKVVLKIDGETAHISLDIPKDYRNNYVQPGLIIYGPALKSFETNGVQVSYSNVLSQDSLGITLSESFGDVTINGSYQSVVIDGKGSLDASSSAIQKLEVRSTQKLTVSAGTVRELIVTQSDVCGNISYSGETNVSVSGVTSGTITYNGKQMTAQTYRSSCASVVVGDNNDYDYDGRNQ